MPARRDFDRTCLSVCGAAAAQQPNPLDVIPDKMPFNVPYGAPISLARAQAAVAAAIAEAEKHGWALNVAVVDSGANLVAFGRMDGAQLGSIAVSEHKARTSAKFRRPTKVFEDAIQKGDTRTLTIDDVMGSRGGVPLIEDGKLDRRDRLLRRRRLAGRGRVHRRRGDDREIATPTTPPWDATLG